MRKAASKIRFAVYNLRVVRLSWFSRNFKTKIYESRQNSRPYHLVFVEFTLFRTLFRSSLETTKFELAFLFGSLVIRLPFYF